MQWKGQHSEKASTAKRLTQWKGQCSEKANAVKRPAQWKSSTARRPAQWKVLLGSGGGPGDANPPKNSAAGKSRGVWGGMQWPPRGLGCPQPSWPVLQRHPLFHESNHFTYFIQSLIYMYMFYLHSMHVRMNNVKSSGIQTPPWEACVQPP